MEQHSPKGNGMAVAALALGIASIPTICCTGFGFPIAATGVILALLSRRGRTMNAQAKVGFCLSLASLIITIVIMVSFVAYVFSKEEFQAVWDAISEIDLSQFESQEEMQKYLQDYIDEFFENYQGNPAYNYDEYAYPDVPSNNYNEYYYPDMPSFDFVYPDTTFDQPSGNNLI